MADTTLRVKSQLPSSVRKPTLHCFMLDVSCLCLFLLPISLSLSSHSRGQQGAFSLHAEEKPVLCALPVPPRSSPPTASFPLLLRAGAFVVCSVPGGSETCRSGGGGASGARIVGRHDFADVARRVLVAALVTPLEVVLHQRALLHVSSALHAGPSALPVGEGHFPPCWCTPTGLASRSDLDTVSV